MVKNFPLLLISYNRLSYLRQQVDHFRSLGFSRIVILDNASTYEPLLVWFDQIEKEGVVVERLPKNYLCLVSPEHLANGRALVVVFACRQALSGHSFAVVSQHKRAGCRNVALSVDRKKRKQ